MLCEFQLAYVSVPHYTCFPFINILLAQACMCVLPTRQDLLLTRPFNDHQIFRLLPSLAPFSLHLYLSHHLPLLSAHLSFIIFHYIHFLVCLQKCPCSHPPPLLPCLYFILILFYRFLSSRRLIPTH